MEWWNFYTKTRNHFIKHMHFWTIFKQLQLCMVIPLTISAEPIEINVFPRASQQSAVNRNMRQIELWLSCWPRLKVPHFDLPFKFPTYCVFCQSVFGFECFSTHFIWHNSFIIQFSYNYFQFPSYLKVPYVTFRKCLLTMTPMATQLQSASCCSSEPKEWRLRNFL